MEVHRELGKGHDEVIYKDALQIEFRRKQIEFSRENNISSNIKILFFRISILRILW